MKKAYKLLMLLLTVCLLTGALALAACGDKDKNVTYTIEVQCEDTVIFGGLSVRLKKENGETAEEKSVPRDGKVTFSLESGTYTADLTAKPGFESIFEDYYYTMATVTADRPAATIEVLPTDAQGAETIGYSVKVLLPDGSPAAALRIQLCGGPSSAYACHEGVTDENGVASFSLPAGNYDVHIDAPPAGSAFDNNAYKMTAEGGSLTVTLTAE